jgi:hypothetical protein
MPVRGHGRVLWVCLAAVLSIVLGAAGFRIGGELGAGIGVAAGVLVPLLVEWVTNWLEALEQARRGEPPREYGPAHLLEPGLGIVPFAGRAKELEALKTWCLNDGELLRLVTGPGGSGKTRLARELCVRMKPRRGCRCVWTDGGWRCVWVDEGDEGQAVARERAARPSARLLLVVDYAEARAGLDELLKAATRDEGCVRLLLLARHAGDWRARARRGTGHRVGRGRPAGA